MPAALPFQTEISRTSAGDRAYRVETVQYGNGYAQRMKDVINNAVESWNVEWESLDLTQLTTLSTAFDTAAGTDYFTWTPPGSATQKKFIVSKFSVRNPSGAYYHVAASLTQDYSL